MTRRRLIVVTIASLVGALVLLRPLDNAWAQDGSRSTPGYFIQPGDMLHISVWKEKDLDQDVLVRPDGGFSFPLAGNISAVGKTVEDLRKEVANRLRKYIPDLVVTVSVTQINGNKVYVIGQVNKPGQFVMNPSVDVMQALSIAGGTTPFAALNDIFVLRRVSGKQTVLPFRYNDVIKKHDLSQNVELKSGDVVVVP